MWPRCPNESKRKRRPFTAAVSQRNCIARTRVSLRILPPCDSLFGREILSQLAHQDSEPSVDGSEPGPAFVVVSVQVVLGVKPHQVIQPCHLVAATATLAFVDFECEVGAARVLDPVSPNTPRLRSCPSRLSVPGLSEVPTGLFLC